MSTKQIVQDLLQKLPENVSLHDVAQEIEFVAGVRQGLAEIERGVILRPLPLSSLHHAATAPRSTFAELGVVRRFLHAH